ncbi:hypothetical protein [uncultured Nocardioides sp.]|uniref:hypothetical protein n=1 Tax=uncultured Nocardioides sp. TaxID=198441 RepID=UPI00261C723E|nr:hypothetical protein [uncultured Nocardioides sp.]
MRARRTALGATGRVLGAALAAALTLGVAGSPSGAEGDRTTPASARATSWQPAGSFTTSAPVTGLDVDPAGRVVVATEDRRVRTHDRTGEVVSTFRAPIPPGSLDVAVDGLVHLMVDPGAGAVNRTMRVFGPRGRLVRTYGRNLPVAGGFQVVEDLRRVIYADGIDDKIRTYDTRTGAEVDTWGENGNDGTNPPGRLDFAADLALLSESRLVVADSGRKVLLVFGRGGRHLRTLGERYFGNRVRRVAAGGGRLFGLEPGGERSQVEMFSETGTHLRTLRTDVRRAADLAVSPDGRTLFVAGELPSGEPGVIRYVRR